MGNRIAKHVYDDNWNMERSTYYILDAQGNTISTYDHEVDDQSVIYNLKERHIYGSSALGILMDSLDMYAASTGGNVVNELGFRYYQLSEHRGNVLTVINDIKTPLSNGTTVDSYQVGIVNITDYSGFGVELDGRTIKNGKFRRSFQGQEADSEVFGESDYINFKYRGYDPRVARFSQIDPLAPKYPWNSVYAFSENKVIHSIELEGLESVELNAQVGVAVQLGSTKQGNSIDATFTVGAQTNFDKPNSFSSNLGVSITGTFQTGGLGTAYDKKLLSGGVGTLEFGAVGTIGFGQNSAHPFVLTNSKSPTSLSMDQAVGIGIGRTYSLGTRGNQIIGSSMLKGGPVSLNLQNDQMEPTMLLFGGGSDKFKTGGGQLNFGTNRSPLFTFGMENYSGKRIEADVMAPYEKNGHTYFNQPTMFDSKLNSGRTFFRISNFSNTISKVEFSAYGKFHMYPQNIIHDKLKSHRFESNAPNGVGIGIGFDFLGLTE